MAFNNEESHSEGIGPKYLEEDMAKNHDKMSLYQSPIYLFVTLSISVIVAEMQIMICFHFLPPFPMVIGAVIDSLLLFPASVISSTRGSPLSSGALLCAPLPVQDSS